MLPIVHVVSHLQQRAAAAGCSGGARGERRHRAGRSQRQLVVSQDNVTALALPRARDQVQGWMFKEGEEGGAQISCKIIANWAIIYLRLPWFVVITVWGRKRVYLSYGLKGEMVWRLSSSLLCSWVRPALSLQTCFCSTCTVWSSLAGEEQAWGEQFIWDMEPGWSENCMGFWRSKGSEKAVAKGTGAEEKGAPAKHTKMVIWRWQPLWGCLCVFEKPKRGGLVFLLISRPLELLGSVCKQYGTVLKQTGGT